jgi:hypothetical protein
VAVGRHWHQVDAVCGTVGLNLVRSQLAGVVNLQDKVVDPTRLAHSIHKHLKRQGECVGLLPEAVYPRLVRVVVGDANDVVLVGLLS